VGKKLLKGNPLKAQAKSRSKCRLWSR